MNVRLDPRVRRPAAGLRLALRLAVGALALADLAGAPPALKVAGNRLLYPVIVSEFGSIERRWPFPPGWKMTDERWNRTMLAALEAHRWNWTAWDFHVSAWPCLIADWNYTPTPEFGVWVKQTLAGNLQPR